MSRLQTPIRRNDNVIVTTGRDSGKRGRVLRVLPDKNRVVVEGVALIKRHTRPNPQRNIKGGIVEREAAIHASRYSVTQGGERAAPRFCYGHRSVTAIDSFTPPAQANGFPETQVSYRYEIKDVPVWAKTPEVQAAFPEMAKADDPLVKEMIYLAVSVTNGCGYCIASHTAAARKAGMSDAMFAEVMAVTGMANETNRLVNGYRVPIDAAYNS